MSAKKDAAPGATGCGAINTHNTSDFRSKKLKAKAKIHYLNVRPNGTELWFDTPPDGIRTTRVQLVDGYEFRSMPRIRYTTDSAEPPFPIQPRGAGWHFWGVEGCRSLFRRPAPRKRRSV